jgi:cell division septation protein DedD
MTDEGVHEIQLSGKQLVFLFMAVTVVAVVIFLCGVLVGRGVRAVQDQAARIDAPTAPAAPVTEPTTAPGAAASEPLTYPRRLTAAEPPADEWLSSPAKSGAAPPAGAEPPPPAEPPPGEGYTVQVAALRGQPEAAAIAARLVAKGYPAYVVGPSPEAPASVYRVRVGKYADRREAERVLRRLEQEEQFRPWITR